MSDDDSSETIHSESEMSEDSDSGDSLASFVADDDEEPEVCLACHTEICVSNIVSKKRRHVEVDHESGSNAEESSDDEGDSDDSSSDYVPSEAGESSEETSSSEDE